MKNAASKKIDYGILPQLIGYQLRLTQVAVFRDFAESVGDSQITPSLFAALMVIEANPGLKQAELARAVRLDRSTVVSAIDKLERKNLVERKPVAGDRRTNSLVLTDEGKSLLAQLIPQIEAHEDRLAAQLTDQERAVLINLLSKIFSEDR
ncbi:MarR family winged helix-turn-helix transcriptional regulator [Motiliproteus sp. MSK22-1]|uniref:MarR family winged helix-turn-helix transcriptional regulator n=1 Tax=Motiliproteus sp. MSK22-1 TaxID=1897630 RepID=UPI0009755C59|nr:MarR family transcriptional regulator [Motiliproteus sp. MSK22-1]OMH29179.1 MarR family transcriptional regulator [Motiliproteus sp. MSK22-1]